MKKNVFVLILSVLLIMSILAGCGAKAPMENAAADAPAAMAPEMDMSTGDSLTSSASKTQAEMPQNQKIIVTMHMNAQTEDLNALLESVNSKIAELGGYVEGQEIYNGHMYDSYRYRYANITIRIPADQLNGFVGHVEDNANVVSQNTYTEDVTLNYVAVESRIAALEAERDRLLALMENAEDMDTLLKIDARLTDVLSELEQVNSQLRVYDNKINYSTIHLNLEEVKEYTPVEEEPDTVWERISTGFAKSMKNVGKGLTNLFVFFVVSLPYLLPIAAAVTVVLLIVFGTKRLKERKRCKAEKSEPQDKSAE